MNRKYRVGIIGFAHMHVNHVAACFAAHPRVELAACADTVPLRPELRVAPYTRAWNRNHALTELGVPRAYDDYHEMLRREKLDIAIVTCENAQHAAVVEACAAAGTHACVEKPMAASYADALRMARAAAAGGTKVITNWPTTWSPEERKLKQLVDEGAVGRVIEVKWRAGHTGPLGPSASHQGVSETAAAMTGPERGATWWHQAAAGGGAMLDYCCYGALLAHWFTGEHATAALGLKANLASQWGDAEDNAAILVRFPAAMALLEGSWTTLAHGVPPGPIVYGISGVLVANKQDDRGVVRLERGPGDTTIYEGEPLPAGRADIAQELIHYLEAGDPLHPTLDLDMNLHAMAILDAGVRSATSGRLEPVHGSAWEIG
jgi:predicted dehydrogenase